MKPRAFVFLLVTGLLVWSCGESARQFGEDAGIDAGQDAGGDPGGDPETDAGQDANGDQQTDAGQDANGDLELDAGQESDGGGDPVQNGCLGTETFSLHDVTYKFPDESEIADWAETCVLSSATFSDVALNAPAVIFDYDKRDGTEWFPVDNSVANPWIFFRDENDNFNWHGHTWDWMLTNQTTKYALGIELAATPAQGECIGLMVSGLIRGSAHINVSERSNIVFVEWPWAN
ncbi:MAG: hypothetical protein JRF33_06195 [Deltaproteobacteria bacterium]|nr:hypothetical protein [Deltaproteobacteria bacterium]